MAGWSASNSANLRDAIAGEGAEAATVYPGFANQALLDQFPDANAFWLELAGDEQAHHDAFAQALTAIEAPSSGATIPSGPAVDAYPIAAAPASVTGATFANMDATMHGESFANAKYLTYAQIAQRTKQPRLAKLWESTGAVELEEHFAEAASRFAGLVGPTANNLRDAIRGEVTEATETYPTTLRRRQRRVTPKPPTCSWNSRATRPDTPAPSCGH